MQDGKVCTKCKEQKLYSEFYKTKKVKDGYQSWCIKCTKADNMRAYYENPQKRSADAKLSRIRNSYRKYKKNQCESCGFNAIDSCQLDVDHIDGNKNNNDPQNLQTLCANCHRLKSKLNRDNLTRYKISVVK